MDDINKFQWNIRMTKRVIEFYETNSFLHNSQDKDYKNPSLRKLTLMKLGEELGCTVKELITKWNHLKTYFTREQKKVSESKSSGTGTDYLYTPKWEFFNDLEFLRTSVKTRPSQSSFAPVENGIAGPSKETEFFEDIEPDGICYDELSDNEGNEETRQQQTETSVLSNSGKSNPSFKRKKKDKTVSDEALEEAVKWLKTPTCSGKDDEEFHFGMLCAAKLRALEPYVRDQLKLQIMQLLIVNTHQDVHTLTCE